MSASNLTLAHLAFRGPSNTYDEQWSDANLTHVPISVSAIGMFALIPARSGLRISVHALMLWVAGANDIQLWNGGVPLTGPLSAMPAQFSLAWPISIPAHFLLDAGAPFELQTSSVQLVSGYIRYKSI